MAIGIWVVNVDGSIYGPHAGEESLPLDSVDCVGIADCAPVPRTLLQCLLFHCHHARYHELVAPNRTPRGPHATLPCEYHCATLAASRTKSPEPRHRTPATPRQRATLCNARSPEPQRQRAAPLQFKNLKSPWCNNVRQPSSRVVWRLADEQTQRSLPWQR